MDLNILGLTYFLIVKLESNSSIQLNGKIINKIQLNLDGFATVSELKS